MYNLQCTSAQLVCIYLLFYIFNSYLKKKKNDMLEKMDKGLFSQQSNVREFQFWSQPWDTIWFFMYFGLSSASTVVWKFDAVRIASILFSHHSIFRERGR